MILVITTHHNCYHLTSHVVVSNKPYEIVENVQYSPDHPHKKVQLHPFHLLPQVSGVQPTTCCFHDFETSFLELSRTNSDV